jgi:ribonucleoside-diphosphate reductase alpha chain
MTGWAYRTSARIAEVTGPFDGYAPNADAMIRVMRKHRAAADEIDPELVPEGILSAAKQAWDEAIGLGEIHGYRNAQASVLAPTGTIGLMMDCDTTGIEPELALVKTKKLVGGGTMQFVNQTVPRALDKLGYAADQIEDVVAYIAEHNSVVEAPHLRPEHYAVFDTAMGSGADPLHGPRAHDGGRAALHLGRDLQDGEHAGGGHGRRGGAAVPRELAPRPEGGRDLPRQLQSGSSAVGGQEEDRRGRGARRLGVVGEEAAPAIAARTHHVLPGGDAEGYITAGSYPDDGLGEIFLKASSRARPCRASWTPSRSPCRWVCSTACRSRTMPRSSSI